MSIQIKNLRKEFGYFRALDDVSFSADRNEFVAILGPSGCGKTTLLRIIAGLEAPTCGEIVIDGVSMTQTPPQNRGLGMVFQHYALFKNMTVRENIGFGLRIRKAPPEQAEKRIDELLNLVRLKGLEHLYPRQLSGGQQQRVALARALAVEAKIMLLDEPFGALDAKVREELRVSLKRLHDEIGFTAIFVTHDQQEALELADKVIVMNKGKIEQVGTPIDVYEKPATEFVANFVGQVNMLPGVIRLGTAVSGTITSEAPEFEDGTFVNIVIRPDDVLVRKEPDSGINARIIRVRFLGSTLRLDLELNDGNSIFAYVSKNDYKTWRFGEGDRVSILIGSCRIFPIFKGIAYAGSGKAGKA